MKSLTLIQAVSPARALVAALGLGLFAASLELATSPTTNNKLVSKRVSLCCHQ